MGTYDEREAVSANGTVRPSANPMVKSRSMSPKSLWCSTWGIFPLPSLAFSRVSEGGSGWRVEVDEEMTPAILGCGPDVLIEELNVVCCDCFN